LRFEIIEYIFNQIKLD